MRRRGYALIIIMAIAASLFGLLAPVIAGPVNQGGQSAIVTVTAVPGYIPPPTGGGGGGGGGGTQPPTPLLPPGTTVVTDLVSERGEFTATVVIRSPDYMCRLSIPEGTLALTGEGMPLGEISIAGVESLPDALPSGASIVAPVYDLGPEGVTFNPAITLYLTYDPALLPVGFDERNLGVVRWDGEQWVELYPSIVDPITHTISALVSHFSLFTIVSSPIALIVYDLTVTPEDVDIGETVTISVLITNGGYLTSTYEVTLEIDGLVEETRRVKLAVGDSGLVSFSTVKDTAGTYSVSVNGLTGVFTVEGGPVVPSLPSAPLPPQAPSALPIIGGIIAASAAAAGLTYYLLRRRYRYAAGAVIGPPVVEERPLAPPLPQPVSYVSGIGRGIAAVLKAIVSVARFVVSQREVVGRGIAAVLAAIVSVARFVVSQREVVGRAIAAVLAAIVSVARSLVSQREVVGRAIAAVLVAIVSGARSLVSQREVVGRAIAAVLKALVVRVRFLVSKLRPKEPR